MIYRQKQFVTPAKCPTPRRADDENQGNSTDHGDSSGNSQNTSIDLGAGFRCRDGEEMKFIESVRLAVALNEQAGIETHGDRIVAGFMKCLRGSNDAVLIAALNLILDVMPLARASFESHLNEFIHMLLEMAQNVRTVSLNASSVLRWISSQFPPHLILRIGLQSRVSPPLLSLAGNVVRHHEEVLQDNEIAKGLLRISCDLYRTTTEQRFSALAVGLLNKIHETNKSVFADVSASASDECRATLKALHLIEDGAQCVNPPPSVVEQESARESVSASLATLAKQKHKREFFQRLNDEMVRLGDVREIVECLAPIIRSAYFEEATAAIETLSAQPDVLRHSMNCLKSAGSAASADLLRVVIRGSQPRDLGPCTHEIVTELTKLTQSENAIDRKSAIQCFAEMRKVIGRQFDAEIGTLSSVSRKMVQYYVDQNRPTVTEREN
jgi:hypothetical protein